MVAGTGCFLCWSVVNACAVRKVYCGGGCQRMSHLASGPPDSEPAGLRQSALPPRCLRPPPPRESCATAWRAGKPRPPPPSTLEPEELRTRADVIARRGLGQPAPLQKRAVTICSFSIRPPGLFQTCDLRRRPRLMVSRLTERLCEKCSRASGGPRRGLRFERYAALEMRVPLGSAALVINSSHHLPREPAELRHVSQSLFDGE